MNAYCHGDVLCYLMVVGTIYIVCCDNIGCVVVWVHRSTHCLHTSTHLGLVSHHPYINFSVS